MKWIAYTPGDQFAIKLIDNNGRATHSVARVKLKDGWKYECWRNPGTNQRDLFAVSTDAAEAKRVCEEDLQKRAAA